MLQARVVLDLAFGEVLSQIKKCKCDHDFKRLYEDCYVCQPPNEDYLEGTGLRTPLNSAHAETKQYYSDAKKIVDGLKLKKFGGERTTQIISQEDSEDDSDYDEVEERE